MTQLVSYVQNTAYDLTPGHLRLPPTLWSVFALCNKAHTMWRWYRRAEVYSNPNNFSQLLAGHVVNFAIGDMMLVRVAAQCLLVATRLLDCAQQQAALCAHGRRWLLSLKGHYPKPMRVQWNKGNIHPCCSPSHVHWWKTTALTIRERIERIAWKTLVLFKEAFRLSMCIMDAIDSLSLTPESRYEGVTEGFVNITKWLDAIVDNKDELLQGLYENKAVIKHLLKTSPITYEQLYEGVNNTLQKTEAVQKGIKRASEFAGGAVVEMGKRALSDGMVVIGLKDYRPLAFARGSI
jgi:hypothetical protein